MHDDHRPDSPADAGATPWLSIGALARAAGVPVETLRTWERRYDFPQPSRLPSGHRRYSAQAIEVLVRVRRLLAEGHRASDLLSLAAQGVMLPQPRAAQTQSSEAGDDAVRAPAVVGAMAQELNVLGGASSPGGAPSPGGASSIDRAIDRAIVRRLTDVEDLALRAGLAELLDAALRLDATRLDRALSWQWQRRGGIGFLVDFCGPLLVQIGLLWRDSTFDVHHEHFASERIRDFLVSRTQALAGSVDVWVVAATISGERHVLGLHMAAAALTMAGVGVVFLGADMPIQELATATSQIQARGVVISVSEACKPEQVSAQLLALRETLPANRAIAVGGQGAMFLAPMPGVLVLGSLPDLQGWAFALRASSQEVA